MRALFRPEAIVRLRAHTEDWKSISQTPGEPNHPVQRMTARQGWAVQWEASSLTSLFDNISHRASRI